MNSEICSNFSAFRCWNWRLIMILGNFSYLLDMCKIFDKYHVWSWAPTSIWGPSVRGPNWTGAQVSVFLRVDTWAPKKGAKTTAVFLYFCILNPPPTKTATVFLYLQYNPDHSKTIQHIHWNPDQHLSSYIHGMYDFPLLLVYFGHFYIAGDPKISKSSLAQCLKWKFEK